MQIVSEPHSGAGVSPATEVWTCLSGQPEGITQPRRGNPKGIESFSPGLRGTSYPGFKHRKTHEPCKGCITGSTGPFSMPRRRVDHLEGNRRCNPFRVNPQNLSHTQGSSCLATLGSAISSFQDDGKGGQAFPLPHYFSRQETILARADSSALRATRVISQQQTKQQKKVSNV
jgi:hypothetical protein